jgi:hypothetical protein
MKHLKKIMPLLMLFALQARAGLPEGIVLAKEKASVISLRNYSSTFVMRKLNLSGTSSSFTFAGNGVNVAYVSGLQKEEKTSAISILLKWDLRFKFRLNRNMNLIFSYN